MDGLKRYVNDDRFRMDGDKHMRLLACAFTIVFVWTGPESYCGQRERKSVWQGFRYKSKICELVSGKLSTFIYTQLNAPYNLPCA